MSIGSKIKQIREKKGLTQENMAEMLGMSQPNYNKIESDKSKAVSWETIQKIAQTLEIDLSELQGEDYKVNITNQARVDQINVNDNVVYNQNDERFIQLMEKRIDDKDKMIALQEQQSLHSHSK